MSTTKSIVGWVLVGTVFLAFLGAGWWYYNKEKDGSAALAKVEQDLGVLTTRVDDGEKNHSALVTRVDDGEKNHNALTARMDSVEKKMECVVCDEKKKPPPSRPTPREKSAVAEPKKDERPSLNDMDKRLLVSLADEHRVIHLIDECGPGSECRARADQFRMNLNFGLGAGVYYGAGSFRVKESGNFNISREVQKNEGHKPRHPRQPHGPSSPPPGDPGCQGDCGGGGPPPTAGGPVGGAPIPGGTASGPSPGAGSPGTGSGGPVGGLGAQ